MRRHAGTAPRRLTLEDFRPGFVLIPVAIVSGYLLARSLVSGGIMLAGLLAGFVLVVALAQRPWLPYVGAVVVVSTFAEAYALPQIGIPGNPYVFDLVLLAAFAAWVLVLGREDVASPTAFPLAPQLAIGALLVGGLFGIYVATRNGATLTDAMRYSREVVFYATFWLALTALADARSRAVVFRLAVIVAVAIVVAQVVQGVLGPGTLLFYSDDPLRELITCTSGSCNDPGSETFPRIRPPGLVIVYVVACFSAAYLLFGPRRRRLAVGGLLAVCTLGVLISLNRNMMIGIVVGLGLSGLLAARRGRFALTLVICALVAAVSLTAVSGSVVPQSTIAERVLSLTNVSELESSSTVTDRLRENRAALDALSSSPIEGVGWAVPYGMSSLAWRGGELRREDQLFIHNQYLGVWLRTGLLGLVGLLVAVVLGVVYGTSWLRTRGEEGDAWVGAGVVTAITGMAVSSLVAIYILHPSYSPVLAGLIALATVLRRDVGADAISERETLNRTERRAPRRLQ